MGFSDIPRHTDSDDPNDMVTFKERVAWIFPDSSASRLARVGNVNTRTAQKWLAGEAPPPADVQEYVDRQFARVGKVRLQILEDAVSRASDDGVDNEVIAAHLSLLYAQLTGQKIR